MLGLGTHTSSTPSAITAAQLLRLIRSSDLSVRYVSFQEYAAPPILIIYMATIFKAYEFLCITQPINYWRDRKITSAARRC